MRSSLAAMISCVVGTRPEAIKMAPVIRELSSAPWARCRVVVTGQHRDLVTPILELFGIEPHLTLQTMRPGQTLPELMRRLTASLKGVLAADRPSLVLAQGDTASMLAAALASDELNIPFGHVEAGLRTGNLYAPFPEEANRVIASHLAAVHFAPTPQARTNLLREGIRPDAIHVTGNSVIDALLRTARQDHPIGVALHPTHRLILVTAHRRDCLGEPLRRICSAIAALHHMYTDIQILWPVHPNPAIRSCVEERLRDLSRVHLAEALDYPAFVAAMRRSTIILTDSGGVQEEAPALGKPVLVLREESERPEVVEAGAARLVGHNPRTIIAQASRLLTDPQAYRQMARGATPYGDGRAARRIVRAVAEYLGFESRVRAAG